MKIVRFTAAPDGGSQFVEIDFPVDNASTDAGGHTARRSAVLPAQSTMVTEMPEHLYQDWHPASRRQLLIVLSGTLEVETSDGKKHRCSSGGGVSRGRCRQPWPSHSHHRRPGPRAVRASAARRQSRRLIASYQNSVRLRDCACGGGERAGVGARNAPAATSPCKAGRPQKGFWMPAVSAEIRKPPREEPAGHWWAVCRLRRRRREASAFRPRSPGCVRSL